MQSVAEVLAERRFRPGWRWVSGDCVDVPVVYVGEDVGVHLEGELNSI